MAVIAAAIGALGSAIGGTIVGWYTVHAGHKQWKRDREDSRIERSHQAAMAIADALHELQEAVVTWQADPNDIVALRRTFNVFSRTGLVQSIALTDDELRQRVRTHTELALRVAALAGSIPTAEAPTASVRRSALTAANYIGAVQRHTDALIEALDAHYNDDPLPPYQAPPLDDELSLVMWPSTMAPPQPPQPSQPPPQRKSWKFWHRG